MLGLSAGGRLAAAASPPHRQYLFSHFCGATACIFPRPITVQSLWLTQTSIPDPATEGPQRRLRTDIILRAMETQVRPASGTPPQEAASTSDEAFTTPSCVLSIDESQYQQQLQNKLQKVKDLFATFAMPEVEVFESTPSHYRMRAEFSVWHDKGDMYYVMYDTASKQQPPPRIRVDQFPAGSRLMNELMVIVREEALGNPLLRDKLFQVGFLTTLSGQAVVVLVYHKKLDELWEAEARKLRGRLAAAVSCKGQAPHIIGRSRKQKVCLDQDFAIEELEVNGRKYVYKQVEGSFTQPNGGVCQHMLSWAQKVTRHAGQDLLELYCGNGNFTLPLAANFRKVVATEVSKTSVEAARYNLQANQVDNVFIARMASEEFTETWKVKGTRRRLDGLSWDTLALKTIFVDPPRSGLDDQTVQLLAEFDRVLYVSCNPDTLHANLTKVNDTHVIQAFAVFDQFPYTGHLECGAYLVRKDL